MTAYYNEIDPYAAQWLRNLIAAGHIASGDVDERSIVDVQPDDLRGYVQCHFFAGIGVWSLAARLAGVRDDMPLWTGSCPCQPFSAAGQGKGFADERHLWPEFQRLIGECAPAVVAGEQVASKDADPWLDLVHTDLEALGYAFGAVAFPSAGVGAPHIRDRTYWAAVRLADTYSSAGGQGRADVRGWLDGSDAQSWPGFGSSSVPSRLDNAHHHQGLEGFRGGPQAAIGYGQGSIRPAAAPSESGGLADAAMRRHKYEQHPDTTGVQPAKTIDPWHGRELSGHCSGTGERPGPTNGYWSAADWLGCRDGKWRPVEPGTFPLAHGAAARVGRLRAYGNAINAQAAKIFLECLYGQ